MTGQTFTSLSRSTQLHRLRGAAFAALERYKICPERMRLLQYEDNAVYMIEDGRRRYTLRMSVHEGRSVAEQESELRWMELLRRKTSVCVPEPVYTHDGMLVNTVASAVPGESSTAVVFGWITGRSNPAEITQRLAESWGRSTAELHRLAHPAGLPSFMRPHWDRADIFEYSFALGGSCSTEVIGGSGVELLRAVNSRLSSSPPSLDADFGLIHADLHRGNVVVLPDGGTGIIDFDDCGFGPLMLDIATALSSIYRLYTDDSDLYFGLAARFLDAYQDVRPLPASFDRLEEFLILRDVIILNFIAHSQNPTVAQWGPGRTQGILKQLHHYLMGHAYPGSLT